MGNLRSQPETTKHTIENQNNRLKFVATGMCGWRKFMEDAHVSLLDLGDGNSLFAVFDGHGGPEVAGFVAQRIVTELTKNADYKSKNYQKALTQTYLVLDRIMKTPQGVSLVKKVKEDNQKRQNASTDDVSQAGCTAVSCLITQNQIYVANAGDSRCFLGIGNKSEDMSIDHKPDLPKEAQRIKKAGGSVIDGRVNGNLNLSRALGDLQYKTNTNIGQDEQLIIGKPDVVKKPLAGVNYIVLGCDGIFETKSNQDIYNLILQKKSQPLKSVAQDIVQSLLSKNSESEFGLDNMSLIIVKIK